tara:strand:- start:304 stop:1143 length:840 start_codon:yes stop_codon:yes gene_type:complete
MIFLHLTNGFGNNLFQYIAARLLAEKHNKKLIVIPPSKTYYGTDELKKINVQFSSAERKGNLAHVNDTNYLAAFKPEYSEFSFVMCGYFEDYRYYIDHIEKIKTWFPQPSEANNKDLVIHLRAGDRLFYKNEFDTKPTAEHFKNAIKNFNFDGLHIVSDMPKWEHINTKDLNHMSFHYNVPKKQRVEAQKSVDYFNSLVDCFSKYNPVFKKRSVADDFQFIRGFKNILFQHGTMSWWAAALSEAERVGVYGPWRPWKGASNKNLSNVPIDSWFKWGEDV